MNFQSSYKISYNSTPLLNKPHGLRYHAVCSTKYVRHFNAPEFNIFKS